jgi:hypothetical protein
MEYLAAAQSLAYVFTACCWFAVWRAPTMERRSFAALITALCFGLSGFRIALCHVIGPH